MVKEGKRGAAVLLFGGIGNERRISCLGAANLLKKAKRVGIDLLPVGISPSGDWYICPADEERISSGECFGDADLIPTFVFRKGGVGGLITDGGFVPVDTVIPLLHGDFGEDGIVQGALDAAGIKYFGCDTAAGAIAYDKAYTKILAESIGIPVVPWILYVDSPHKSEYAAGRIAYTESQACALASDMLGCRLFVKPARSGSSVGASAVERESELIPAIRRALECSERVIIERLVENKVELECAYFGCEKELITPPAAISIRGFYDYLTKYGDIDIKTQTVFPNEEIKDKLKHYTGALSGLLAVKDISRFDYFLTESGEIYFNEVNTFPGFTERSLYLDMLAASGIGDDEFLRAAIREVPL